MLSRTEGNCVRPLMLGSHASWLTALTNASPCKPACCLSHRSASTTWVGYVEPASICATRGSGYKAIGATSCCNSAADGAEDDAGAVVGCCAKVMNVRLQLRTTA